MGLYSDSHIKEALRKIDLVTKVESNCDEEFMSPPTSAPTLGESMTRSSATVTAGTSSKEHCNSKLNHVSTVLPAADNTSSKEDSVASKRGTSDKEPAKNSSVAPRPVQLSLQIQIADLGHGFTLALAPAPES